MEPSIVKFLGHYPAICILGPRQVGKTTLAKYLIGNQFQGARYIDLELPSDRIKLQDPELFLQTHKDFLVIIDEIQRDPDIFLILRGVIDRDRKNGKYLLLGSASPELLTQSAETLAGRIKYIELHPLSLLEIDESQINKLWLTGGFPSAYLAQDISMAFDWLQSFVATYVERDIAILGLRSSSRSINALFRMLSSVHGNLLNTHLLSKSLGISNTTARRYVDYLEHAFLIRRLEPLYINSRKRLTKSPKLYLRDSGILHSLLGITSNDQLERHFLKGNSWEGFAIQQIISKYSDSLHYNFYRTQDGSEMDLVVSQGIRILFAIEIKLTNSPKLTKGNYFAYEAIQAERNYVITPSSTAFMLSRNIKVCSLIHFLKIEYHLPQ